MGHKKSQKNSKQCPPIIIVHGQKNRDCSDSSCDSSECHEKKTIKGDLKVCRDAHFKKDVKIGGSLKVKGPTSLYGGLTVVGGETVDNLTVTGDTILNNVTINGDITPVDRTITIGVDPGFPTIQSAFDFLKGKAVDDALIIIPSPVSGFVVYNEVITIEEYLGYASQAEAMPLANYPVNPALFPNHRNHGVSLRGDPRYIAGMTYISGAQLNYFNDSTAAGYVRKLGTPYGIVGLTNPNPNQITVSIVAIPAIDPEHNTGPVVHENPDFTVEGVLPGDQILIRDDSTAGAWTQHSVTSIIGGNTIAYDGANVPNLTLGASLVIMPRVQINAPTSLPAFTNFFVAAGITIQGIWFRNATNSGSAVQVANGETVAKFGQCVFDLRGSTGSIGLLTQFGAQSGTEIGGIVMHNTIIQSSMFGILVQDAGKIDSGDWCIFDSTVYNIFILQSNALAFFSSVNLVGAGQINLNSRLGAGTSVNTLIGSYKSRGGTGNGGVTATRGGRINLTFDNLQINNTGIATSLGVQMTNGGSQLTLGTTALYGSATVPGSNIVGCTQGILINGGSEFVFQGTNALGITNCGIGIIEQGASKFSTQSNIVYSGTPIERAIEVQSIYSAVNSTETPKGVLTYTTSGIMDSTIQNQLVDTSSPLAITMNPALIVNGITVYEGKTYSFYASATSQQQHTLTLPSALFMGIGGPAKAQAKFNGANPGEGLTFTVMSATQVQVLSFDGVTFL